MIAAPELIGTIRRVNSRNVQYEARELKTLEDFLLDYPWWQAVVRWSCARAARPRKWKVTLYDLALSLLPVSVTLYVSSASDVPLDSCKGEDYDKWRATLVTFVIYILVAAITIGLRAAAEKHSYKRDLPLKIWVSYLGLVLLGIASGVVSLFSATRVEITAAIAVAVFIALFSQFLLKLPDIYREDAKNAPPHPHAREWRACGCGLLVLVILLVLAIILDRL